MAKSNKSQPDEPKLEYFLPEYGITVQAESLEEAVKLAKRLKTQQDKQEPQMNESAISEIS